MEKKILLLFVATVLLTACNINKKDESKSKSSSELLEVIIKDFDTDGILDSLKVYEIIEYDDAQEEYDSQKRMFILSLSYNNFESQQFSTSYYDNYDIALQGNNISINFPLMGFSYYDVSLSFRYSDEYGCMLLNSFTYCDLDHNDECFKKITGKLVDIEWYFSCSISGRYIDNHGNESRQFFFDDETEIDDEIFNEIYSRTIDLDQVDEVPEWEDGLDFVFKKVSEISVIIEKVQQEKYRERYIDHDVKQGETLYGLSRSYGVSIEDIITKNNLQNEVLTAGVTIRIPIYKKRSAK